MSMKNLWAWLGQHIDAKDAIFAAGLVCLTAGLWQVDVALALTAAGSVLLYEAMRH
jgi:hypothetical protein